MVHEKASDLHHTYKWRDWGKVTKGEGGGKVHTLLSRSNKSQPSLSLQLYLYLSPSAPSPRSPLGFLIQISHTFTSAPRMSEDSKLRKDDHLSLKLDEEPRGGLEGFSGESCDLQAAPDDHYGECRTPVSEDHKIPAVQSCPPTPRKRARPVSSRKRKLHFFESSGREEVELFFQSSFIELKLELSKKADKRRCTSV